MRVDGWEQRLDEVVGRHMALPSQFGVSDCWMLPADAFKAITGEELYAGVRYRTEAGAAKQLRKRGFNTVEDALRARLPETGRLLAQRGDLGVVEINGVISGGFFTSIGFMTRGLRLPEFLPVTIVKTAFRVE
ncbi:DUF6950 family protein [Chelativorans sp.]|uniref:DUF6950 family protein n=1 Tax=Chelativorans sp. TaxID=2203393 RepID=UPI002810FE00|nr:hypothetical protein [Chelativorans sp.]